jgi:hypothetical protein
MNLNTIKLNKIFHELLNIITDLQLIDKDCKKRGCKFSKLKIHDLLFKAQKHILKLRGDLLDAIELDEEGD